MPITPLPTPVPSRADPANFAARGDAFLAALPTFATQANALEANVDAAEAVCLSVAQTVNVTAWSSVTSYVVGANVYDATTLLTYRRKTVGSGGLRPGLNSTDWQLLTGFGDVDTVSNQTLTNKTLGAGSVWAGSAIPVANGGTGATTAANAFAALKQGATSTATGVVELATDAETQAGTDIARAVTPAGLAASVMGFGQTQTDVTASRVFATTYTNSTGRSIQISVRVLQASGAASSQVALTVSGVVVAWSTTIAANFLVTSSVSYSIPNGATYSVSVLTGSMTISSWIEQR